MHPPSPLLDSQGILKTITRLAAPHPRPKENPVVTDDHNATYSLKSLINPIYHQLYSPRPAF